MPHVYFICRYLYCDAAFTLDAVPIQVIDTIQSFTEDRLDIHLFAFQGFKYRRHVAVQEIQPFVDHRDFARQYPESSEFNFHINSLLRIAITTENGNGPESLG